MAEEPRALLENALAMVVAALGDPHEAIFARFYHRFPAAHEAFVRLGLDRPCELEGQMIEQVLYCMMTWLEAPAEVQIVLAESVRHHIETLVVDAAWYLGLFDATQEVFSGALPADAVAERAILADVHHALIETVRRAEEQGRHFGRGRALA